MDGLREGLARAGSPDSGEPYGDVDALLSFWPTEDAWAVPVSFLTVYLAVNWWASWYPGAEPGGGGYTAQRLMACRNERHALLASIWFNAAHYALRPWPWIIVGLCGIGLYGHELLGLTAEERDKVNVASYYVRVMKDHLPAGLRGLLLAAFAAAYMSTISTQLNWGASYLVNDLYRPNSKKPRDPKRELLIARLTTLFILAVSVVFTRMMSSVEEAWAFLMALGAGSGPVLILRWYWWRISARSEISAMLAALMTSLFLSQMIGLDAGGADFAKVSLITLFVTSVCWIAVTFIFGPESDETLRRFYARVRPGGPGWRAVDAGARPAQFAIRGAAWCAGLALVYGLLFGIGHFIFERSGWAWICMSVAFAGGLSLVFLLRQPVFQMSEESQA